MQTSNNGIDLIEQFEGNKLQAYQDVKGVWTIGTGTTIYPNGQRVKKGDVITQAQSIQYLRNHITGVENSINTLVKVPLNQNQFDALVSLVYNIGAGAFSRSSILQKLNSGDYDIDFTVWSYSGGKFVQGLKNRRIQEQQLYDKYSNGSQ